MSPTMIWLMGLLTTLVTGGGWLAKLAANRVWLRDFLERAKHFREDVVLELEQTVVDKLKEATAATSMGGEEVTPEEMVKVRDAGVAKLKDYLGIGAIERAMKLMHLPVSLPGFIDGWLITQVEAAVKRLSIQQVAANAGGVVNNAVVSS